MTEHDEDDREYYEDEYPPSLWSRLWFRAGLVAVGGLIVVGAVYVAGFWADTASTPVATAVSTDVASSSGAAPRASETPPGLAPVSTPVASTPVAEPPTAPPRPAASPPPAVTSAPERPAPEAQAPRKASASKPAKAVRKYWVQVGSFRNAAGAKRVEASLRQRDLPVVVSPGATSDQDAKLLRIRVGPFPTREEATAKLRELEAAGFHPFVLRAS